MVTNCPFRVGDSVRMTGRYVEYNKRYRGRVCVVKEVYAIPNGDFEVPYGVVVDGDTEHWQGQVFELAEGPW